METAHVWWAARQDASARLAALLDDTETARWRAYRREGDRERFLVGCALAKTAVAGRTGQQPGEIQLDRTCLRCGKPHGKPSVKGVELSITHSGDLVAVATACDPVGVDVERADGRGDVDGLARFAMSDTERSALAALSPEDRLRAFLTVWTRKEAVTKATGDGLNVPFKAVEVSPAAAPPRLVAWPYADLPQTVTLFDLQAPPGYAAALAVIGHCAEVRVHQAIL